MNPYLSALEGVEESVVFLKVKFQIPLANWLILLKVLKYGFLLQLPTLADFPTLAEIRTLPDWQDSS